MKKKILVINGHSSKTSLCGALSEKYALGAQSSGHEIHVMHLSDLKFDPILHKGYQEIQPLEPDLVEAQKKITWADHIVVVYPIWWSSIPALLKGFFDRTFLPGFAFQYQPGKTFWARLLKGRTGEIILTTDAPTWWNKWILKDPAIHMVKKGTLEFCGIKVKKVTSLPMIKEQSKEGIEKMLVKIEGLGRRV